MRSEKWLDRALVICVVLMLLLLALSATASERHQTPVDVETNVGGSVVENQIGGNETLALGFSSPSFGAALAQCAGTTAKSFLFGLYGQQKIGPNYWCIGSSLYQMGKYQAAAFVLCGKAGLADAYPTHGECIKDLSAAPQEPEDDVEESFVFPDNHDAELAQQAMALADMEAKLAELQSYEPEQKTIIQNRPLLSESQRSALKELKQ